MSGAKIKDVDILGRTDEETAGILSPEAIEFVVHLIRKFRVLREEYLMLRKRVQIEINLGQQPDFFEFPYNQDESQWFIDAVPPDLEKRWVEITGPAGDRKMVINALNSGADTYMADFEDAQSPTWRGIISGQCNIRDAVTGTISCWHPQKGTLRLNDKTAVLMVRPRGWHLLEKHFHVDQEPVPAGLFDFGLFAFHNARQLCNKKSGLYLYLPKLESALEAHLWDQIFLETERMLDLFTGSIKATVLIESVMAVFQAEAILRALRHHAAGLNVGRWDYIASFGKKFMNWQYHILPDRAQITMEQPFMKAYTDYVIGVCHRHGAHAIGGMAAQIPIPSEPELNNSAINKVRADKEREALAGNDGTWVAHPALVPVAREIFQRHLNNQPHQKQTGRDNTRPTSDQLLELPSGTITEEGIRENVSAFVNYVRAWLSGTGAVPLAYKNRAGQTYAYLMEDAATAEIARTQLYKWVAESVHTDTGKEITANLIGEHIREVVKSASDKDMTHVASLLLESMLMRPDFDEYLTLPAYDLLLALEQERR